MNKERRKQLEGVRTKLDTLLTALGEIDLPELKEQVETARDDEQEYYDNMPEGLQNGDKGEKASTAIDVMEAAVNEFEDIESKIDELKTALEEQIERLNEAAE